MKKQYRLLIEDIVDEVEEDDEGTWLDTGEKTILLPPEIAKYLDDIGIMGIA